MRVYFDVGFSSFGIERVALQLAKYLPKGATIATEPDSADLVVLHVNGRHDHNIAKAKKIKAAGHDYAVIQYVLGSCRNPNPLDWLEFWKDAKVMWSYYDLRSYVPEMFHAPLGADPALFFREKETEKSYLLGTNGNSYQNECIGEARAATFKAGGRMVHVGPQDFSDPVVDIFENITDKELRHIYNQCKWQSALRRLDGFEMIAVEALLCGTRPIMFDNPNYRQWFDGLAQFIPEGSVGDTTKHLTKLLKGPENPVSAKEITIVKKKFDWKIIIPEFWYLCLR